MVYTANEIELTLNLYPIAKKNINNSNNDNMYFDLKKKRIELFKREDFYMHIIYVVEDWLTKLTFTEKQLLYMRLYRRYTYANIANKLGYTGHSSALKKYKKIIEKIKNE